MFLSAPAIQALFSGQWSPWLTAAIGLPWLGFMWAAKPTIGATLFAGWPSRWALGLEMRHHAEIAEYRDWEGYAFYLGPVLSYRTDKWWAALTVMPQIYGANFEGNPDGNTAMDLDGHERLNVRLLFGFSF